MENTNTNINIKTSLNFGDLDGFTVEQAPPPASTNPLDRRLMEDEVAFRAVWMLIKQERWDDLYELGLEEAPLKARLLRVGHYGESLSNGQYRWLRHLLPEIKTASTRLRELYIVKQMLTRGRQADRRK